MSDSSPFSSDHWLSPPVDSSPDWGWSPPSLGEDLLDAESPDVFFPLSTPYNYNLADLISGESLNQELASGPLLQQNRRSPESDLRRSNGLQPTPYTYNLADLISGESSNQELASGPSLQQNHRSPESDLRRSNGLLPTPYNYNLDHLISGESSNQELASGPSLQQNRRSPESDLRRSNGLRPTPYNYNLDHLISGESSNQELASGPSLQQNRRSPESDLRRSNGLRPRNRRFRMSPSDDGDVSPSPMADQLARDIVSSGKDLGNRRKYDAKRLPGDDSYDEFKEKFTAASNFECNICFDIAREPVVTSCGHLFCWSCLYRWLHVHSDFRECPVCKGVVEDANITPIYGRAGDESCVGKEKEGLEIPPRPGGNRHESFRQQLRALTRRSIDAINGEEVIPESVVVSVPQSRNSILLYRDSSDFWHDLAIQSPERIAAVSADRDISVSRFAGGNDPVGRVPTPVPAALLADHSSASSTLAVIHDGIDLNNTSEEPNNVGSSRVHIRRRSGSLDLDEELRHADRRWRS